MNKNTKNHSKSSHPLLSQTTGHIRIIGGKWRGRKLPVINEIGLRPTGDRMKETLFNWLMHDIIDAVCLDLFAGTGSLGFEAASRFAKSVTFIEKSPPVAKKIQENITKLAADNLFLQQHDALTYLDILPKAPFDILFIDPPFRQGLLDTVIQKIGISGFTHPGSLIYVETEKEAILATLPNTWKLLKEKISGQVCYRLYQTS